MSQAPSPLSTLGVWYSTERMDSAAAVAFATRVEALGYSTLWLPETTGRDPFAHIAHLADGTERLRFATGISNIFLRHPGVMKQCAHTLAEQTDGRFLLGLGVSHAPMVEGLRGLDYSSPLTSMRTYLQTMATSPYTGPASAEAPATVVAALGPKMIALAGELADGIHPYWTTPEHTASARAILGPDKLICVEQKVVLTTDAAVAREAARAALAVYLGLPNYRNNWKRLGFSDAEIDSGAERFIDAVVAWGDEPAIRARLDAHVAAGADHVCVQPLNPNGRFGSPDWALLEALAPAAG